MARRFGLSDVAKVEIGAENGRLRAWMNPTPALIVNIQREPGANVIHVVNSIKKLLPTLGETLPAAVTIKPLTDRTITIRASVEDVEFELALAVGLVVMVIFLFLRNIPATIIPSLSVPLSLIGALAIMYQAGFSLDNLSLMALTVATGFVVDDAIVVIENIARFLEQGDSPYDAAMKGSAQIGFTIISLTVSLLAVLIPLLFMGDVVGRLFHEFAITLSSAIVISAVVSLTLVPMLCAKLLRPQGQGHRRGGEASGRLLPGSDPFLCRDVASRTQSSGVHASGRARHIPAHRLSLYDNPEGLLSHSGHRRHPGRDAGRGGDLIRPDGRPSTGAGESDPDRSRRRKPVLVHRCRRIERHAQLGRLLINLKPHAKRKATASEIIRRIQKETANVPGISLFMQPVQDLSIDTAVSATQYQFTLENQDLATLQTWTPKVLQRLSKFPRSSMWPAICSRTAAR